MTVELGSKPQHRRPKELEAAGSRAGSGAGSSGAGNEPEKEKGGQSLPGATCGCRGGHGWRNSEGEVDGVGAGTWCGDGRGTMLVVVAGATIQHGRRGREAASLKPNGGTRRHGREEVKERTVRPEELAGLGGDLLLAARSSEAGIRPRGSRACN